MSKQTILSARDSRRGKNTIALVDLSVGLGGAVRGQTRLDATLRRLDGLTLLEWCVRRLNESTLIDAVVITGNRECRDRISRTGLCDAKWVPSDLETPTLRAKDVADQFDAEWVVFTSPLCPFTDPTLLDRMISRGWAHPDVDFVGFWSPKRPDFSLQSLGLVGEMCSVAAINKLVSMKLQNETCDVPHLLRRNPGAFQSKLIPLPEELSERNLRFELETAEDRDRAASYLEAAGDDLCWQRLAQMSDRLV
ncbi:MAG: cytidylyltransferase domain-containing protein [Pirellula sp.]|jgi:spore coat polysaccharide biosynthesis protein SpsF (cytidylyltransferase family)